MEVLLLIPQMLEEQNAKKFREKINLTPKHEFMKKSKINNHQT